MEIAVVILNWNGQKLLNEFLPSVVEHSKEASIYVIDNASDDDSVAYIKNTYPDVECILNKENKGYAEGYNQGLKHIQEDVYILLNNDVKVTKDWLIPIKQVFEKRPEVAVIQPKILDYKNPDYFEYAGAAGGFIDKFGYPYCRGRIFDEIEKDTGQYDDNIEIFWASGACFAIRKDVFIEAGRFDESYFAHQEEVDLCWRIFNMDYKIWYVHRSVVYHLGGGTLSVLSAKKTFLNFRNSLFNILKNVNSKERYEIIFIRMLLDGLACLKFLMSFQFGHIKAVLQAHFSFYSNFFKIKDSTDSSKAYNRYYDTISIVLEYFVRKRKKFNEIKKKNK